MELKQESADVGRIWGRGPWVGEPDEWQGCFDGFTAHALRMLPLGQWNGYLSLPLGHPWHGKSHNDIDADVHGGLTFAQGNGIKDSEWLIGFDCAHLNDICPGSKAMAGRLGEKVKTHTKNAVYRDLAFVQGELQRLAKQAVTSALAESVR